MIERVYPPAHDADCKEVSLLMVEDDDIDATALKRALHKLKLLNPIYRARDGLEAIELLRSGEIPSPYIILLDLNMPRMNGLEFLEELRSDPALTQAIVFVLTTSKSDEDILAAYKEHVAGYLLKQRMDNDFLQVVGLLNHYWRIVEMPNIAK
ncbi:response regulator [Cellvibrio zantedeschiae]|uniref:Response regulator n=1 Tax=Cellvibrio zantedeschiae TaxID=1237077 RepID=A0ABQ3AX60_9GAMM|nr:response regulator [Cellvibrio zantedeschiae]GGY66872.1 response regulator [Cellvibrio zantedeschiae]